MVRRGHQVLAFAPNHDANTRARLWELGVEAVDWSMDRVGTNPFRDLVSIARLTRLLRHHRPDLCFGYCIKPVIYGTLAAWMAGIPRRYGLIAGLGYAFTMDNGGWRRRLTRHVISSLGRVAAARIDRMMFQNSDDLAEFIGRGITPRNKAVLIGATGIDLEDWPELPLPDGPVTFILVARLLRDKGIDEYITAARALRADNMKARFLLLGGLDDNPAAITQAEVGAWVEEGLIEWPGHVAVHPWLAQAHVFVLPSYREGVPRSTQEAMAAGRPVITTDAPGCRETVVEGVNGFLVPPRDSDALAAAMHRFIEQPQLIGRMGQESRRLAEERFDVHLQNRKMLDCMMIC